MQKKPKMAMLQGLAYLTQVGLSFATPIILFLLGAHWLVQSRNAPLWFYVLALLIGLCTGFMAMLGFANEFKRNAKKHAKTSQQTIPDELKGKIK